MIKWFKIVLIAGLVLMLASLAVTARSQAEVSLSAMEVDLWPEYDDPGVLVIYRITLAPSVSLPVDLTFRLPAAAGDPSAVAVRQVTSSGEAGLFSIPFERQVSGEWGLVTLTATMPEIQLEYYDSGLAKQGSQRRFEYSWPGDYTTDSLVIQVQQPLGARDMRISPATDAGTPGKDGLVYYNKPVGSLSSGQTFRLSFEYQKEGDALSATNLQVQPSSPVGEQAFGQNSLRAVLPWLLGILGVGLIVGGAVWYWKSGRGSPTAKTPRRRRSVSRESAPAAAEGYIYCHQCGKRAAPGDRFCRTCGTQLRVN
ncbi:MAG TPA: zinc ribbon domain-containing protein [Anaerolineales bacterium]|nr:zinc ribbon domain-containing protein [Anaerolineales bacterium]